MVIYDLPVTISGEMIERGMNFPIAWNPDYQARVGLMPRDGEASEIIWSEVSPCYVFHPMNAYDDADGNVVLDVCRYRTMMHRDHKGPLGDGLATLDRWTVSPGTGRLGWPAV